MNTSIRQTRQEKGMSLQQFADLMGVDKLEALSIETDDITDLIDDETRTKAFGVLNDPTVDVEPLSLEDGALNSNLWSLGVAGRLENEHVKEELLNLINSGKL